MVGPYSAPRHSPCSSSPSRSAQRRRRTAGKASRDNSTSTFWRCRGRRRSARPPPNAAGSRAINAARGRSPSSCTACGRSTTRAFRNTASARRRSSRTPLIDSMLDLMPARGLVIHEWKKHGTCAGLAPRAYFEQIRKARATVKIPEQYLELSDAAMVTPDEVEEAFVEANPGLSRAGIAVTCDNRRLQEVRICMGKDLGFRECAEIDRRSLPAREAGDAAGARRRLKRQAARADGAVPLLAGRRASRRRLHRSPSGAQLIERAGELTHRARVIEEFEHAPAVGGRAVHVAVQLAQRAIERRPGDGRRNSDGRCRTARQPSPESGTWFGLCVPQAKPHQAKPHQQSPAQPSLPNRACV